MKVGLILECGPEGADKIVCEHLLTMLEMDIEVSSITLDNKPNLIKNCADSASLLISEGCDRVVIVWDLYPAWREKGEKPCLKEDREQILNKLDDKGLSNHPVFLVCVQEELEAWLLADERAINRFLSTDAHPIKIRRQRNTERVKNPKKVLTNHFQEHKGIKYSDLTHAKKLVENIEDFNRLKKCGTFVRFILKSVDKQL